MTAAALELAPAATPAAKPKLGLGWEPVVSLLNDPDFLPMIQAQQREKNYLPDEMPFIVDWAAVLAAEKAGRLRVWTARIAGRLAGFICFSLEVHPFHMTTVRAMDNAHYVTAKYRGKGTLYRRLWSSALDELRKAGIRVVFGHDDAARPQEAFYHGLGFEPIGRFYVRAL